MTQSIEAIYTHGMLKPLEALPLQEQQHVRVTIETIDTEPANGRDALNRLIERLQRSSLDFGGPTPSREELHERDRHV
jgi:predicted DNA-binding antitoxin AbrB/MazE fold protein